MSDPFEDIITFARGLVDRLNGLRVPSLLDAGAHTHRLKWSFGIEKPGDGNLSSIADCIEDHVVRLNADLERIEELINRYAASLNVCIRKIEDLSTIPGAEIVVAEIRAFLYATDQILRAISDLEGIDTGCLREAAEATPDLVSYVSGVRVLLSKRQWYTGVLQNLSWKIEEAMAGEFYHRMIRAADGLAPLWTVYTW